MPTLSGCNLELVKRPPDGASFLWSVGTCTGKFERRSFDLLGHGAQNDTPMGKEWHPKTGALLSRMRADRYAVCDWLLDPANAFTLRHERDLHTGGVISADKVSLFRADTESAGRAHIKAWAALNGVDVVALTMQGSSLDRFEEDVTIYRATGAEVLVSGKFAKDVQPRLDALRAGMPTAPFVLVRFEADHFDAILDLVAHPNSQGVRPLAVHAPFAADARLSDCDAWNLRGAGDCLSLDAYDRCAAAASPMKQTRSVYTPTMARARGAPRIGLRDLRARA